MSGATLKRAPVSIKKVDSVKWIRLERPDMGNAIATEGADLIREALAQCREEGVRVVVITGGGGSFCSGIDLKEMHERIEDAESFESDLTEHYHPMLTALVSMPMPTVAAIDGVAAGLGCDIALACDIRLASDNAVFSEIYGEVGLIPAGGGTFTLPRLVGAGRALEMALTAQKVRADQALEWGLVNHVYPVSTFKQHVQTYVERLAHKAPMAAARIKQAFRGAARMSDFGEAIENEARLQKDLFETWDFREGVSALLQKRSPNFRGC